MANKNRILTSDYLKYEEYEKLLKGLHSDKLYVWEMYARLSFCTACRISDVLNLRWMDILHKDLVEITEKKTGKTRRIPFNASVKASFDKLWRLMDCPNRTEYIFASSRTGNPMTVAYVDRKLKTFKVKYRIQINNFSSHTFRKTFGRYVYEKCGRNPESLVLLSTILNHANIETTKRYIGVTLDEANTIFNSIAF